MEIKENNCLCNSNSKLVLACSGASDVGHLSDLSARKLRDEGSFKMSCLALVGAGIDKSIADFKSNKLLVIDGCQVDCGKKIMDKNGIDDFIHLRLSDLGFKKGESPTTSENITKIYEKAEAL